MVKKTSFYLLQKKKKNYLANSQDYPSPLVLCFTILFKLCLVAEQSQHDYSGILVEATRRSLQSQGQEGGTGGTSTTTSQYRYSVKFMRNP